MWLSILMLLFIATFLIFTIYLSYQRNKTDKKTLTELIKLNKNLEKVQNLSVGDK